MNLQITNPITAMPFGFAVPACGHAFATAYPQSVSIRPWGEVSPLTGDRGKAGVAAKAEGPFAWSPPTV